MNMNIYTPKLFSYSRTPFLLTSFKLSHLALIS